MKLLKDLFTIEKKPRRGLVAFEWVVVAYAAVTMLYTLFCWTRLVDPVSMLWGRVSCLALLGAMWGVYRLAPCKLLMFMRLAVQMVMLAWWYPDTYEINRILPNLDHVFASLDQQLFGCQPALLFHEVMPWGIWAELMDCGYYCYYYMMAGVMLCYFFMRRQEEWLHCSFIIMAGFFANYVIFDLLPVTGPQYYYCAVGVSEIAQGHFPDLGAYFMTHQECLPSPGMEGGVFHELVMSAHNAGERPTAAFPSSHVGIATICLCLAIRLRSRALLYIYVPLYVLLCLSTVYVMAHYAVDALAGLVAGVAMFFVFDLKPLPTSPKGRS